MIERNLTVPHSGSGPSREGGTAGSSLTDGDNQPSQAVAARLGMTDRGLTTAWYDTRLRLFDRELSVTDRPDR
jgi:hypothetical protein